MDVPRAHILPCRVLHQDDDFITLEVAKHDQVTFHLQQDAEGNTVGGDQFHTMMFVHRDPRTQRFTSWLPWRRTNGT